MNVKINSIKVLMYLCCVYLFGMVFSFNVYAQVDQVHKGMHLFDYSATNVTKGKLELSILDLSSSEKGFLLPKMTTAERSSIPVSELAAGLVVYNTTIDCIEFYNGTLMRWLSTCGDQDPAVFDIVSSTCSSITVDGNYVVEKLVDERSNVIFVDVSVSQPGPFSAHAVAYNGQKKNGYVFSAKGKFPTAGQYRIVLKGSGKPIVGYDKDSNGKPLGEDIIKFYFNEVESACVVKNFVAKVFVPLNATFACSDPNFKVITEGTYKINVPLTANNIIKVPVKVTDPGRGKVYGTIQNGGSQTEIIQYESDVIDFKYTGNSNVQWAILKPVANTGKPTTSGKLTVNFKAISNGMQEYDPFAPISIVEFNNCSQDINVEGNTAKLKFYGGMQFISHFVAPQGLYMTPRTKMGTNGDSRFKMRVNVTVEAVGDYEIITNTVNGVYFKSSGKISSDTAIGSKKVIDLIAYGESESDQPSGTQFFIGSIKNLETGGTVAQTSPVEVEFVYPPMTMLSIGGQGWHPNGGYYQPPTADVWDAGGKLVKSTNNFGWNGKVRIVELKFIGPNDYGDLNVYYATTLNSMKLMNTDDVQLTAYLSQADMVFIGGIDRRTFLYPFVKSNSALDKLAMYVKKGGVLVYGESQLGQMPYLANKLGLVISDALKPGNEGIDAAKFVSYKNKKSELIEGVSGKYFANYGNVTLFGNNIGGSYHASSATGEGKDNCISFVVNTGATVLANYNKGGGTFAFQHKTYSFVGVGSSLFMGGNDTYRNYQHDNSYPVRTIGTGDTPDTAPLSNKKLGPMHNSWFLLNLVHWAIDEAQYNKTKNVQ